MREGYRKRCGVIGGVETAGLSRYRQSYLEMTTEQADLPLNTNPV